MLKKPFKKSGELGRAQRGAPQTLSPFAVERHPPTGVLNGYAVEDPALRSAEHENDGVFLSKWKGADYKIEAAGPEEVRGRRKRRHGTVAVAPLEKSGQVGCRGAIFGQQKNCRTRGVHFKSPLTAVRIKPLP
jgi:hypothetical protein